MTQFILKLLHAPVSETSKLVDVAIAFRGMFQVGWFVTLSLVLGVAVVWMYRVSAADLSPLRKYSLAALRIIFLMLVLALLLRPVLVLTIEGSVRRSLVVLLDTTSSMLIKDMRHEEADLRRVALAKDFVDPRRGLGQSVDKPHLLDLDQVTRLDVMKSVLKNADLHLLADLEKEYDLLPFTFGQKIAEPVRPAAKPPETPQPPVPAKEKEKDPSKPDPARFDWVDDLDAKSPATALGDCIRDVLQRKRGQPLAGMVVISDGSNNSGSSPVDAAGLSGVEGAPLYIYGVGITSPKDIIVANLFADEVVFIKDEVPVTVRVRAQGMAGRKATVKLRLGFEKLDEQEVTFAGDGEQVIGMKFTPPTAGEYDLMALIDPLEDEAMRDNNSFSRHIRVVDSKIKVLLIEQSPRWEFRYLQALLLRDRRIDLKCILLEGDPAITRGEKSPYLEKFPTEKEELYKYDLVILGDVDPKTFAPDQIESLGEFVSKFGGAFMMIAGHRFSPWAYRRTVIEKLLPVEFEQSNFDLPADAAADQPIQLELTAAGKASVMMRLSDKEEESAQIWRQLPPVFWEATVSRAKPAAEVLVVDADRSKASRFGKMPVIALQQYGLGQTMFVGTDNLWRWRRNSGDRFYTMMWGQIVQRLALPHLLGGSKRTQLTADRQNYMSGERVTIYARLYNANYQPMTEPMAKGLYSLKTETGPEHQVTLRVIPEQPGMYRGEFVAPAPGAYKFSVELDPKTQLNFNVVEPKFELGDTAMNEQLLKQMATASSGAFFREEDLFKLPETIRQKSMHVRSTVEVEFWSSPLYFLLMLAVVTTEWILRKLSQLK